jgi:hypothetical protein
VGLRGGGGTGLRHRCPNPVSGHNGGRGGGECRFRDLPESRTMTTNVVTRSFGNDRIGCFVDPSWTLTSERVQKPGMRVLGQLKLDDPRGAEGQVLAVEDLTMSDGKAHYVIFVCDMSNNVYAFDADSYALLWKQNVGISITLEKR